MAATILREANIGSPSARKFKISPIALCLCSAAAIITPNTAIAQNTSTQSQSYENKNDIEAIIVTARRREEALTEVPAAITSIDTEFLADQNIVSFVDYATKIPNLSFQYGGGASGVWANDVTTTIRGVVGDATTAYYINDTPVPAGVSPQVLQLNRIEVLKGPQGTLFGASSMGGNLRYITNKPSLLENTGMAQASIGTTKRGGADVDISVQRNFVLAEDKVAFDAAFGYRHDSGFITKRFSDGDGGLKSRDDQGRQDSYSGSLSLRVQASDSLEVTLNALGQYTDLKGFPATYINLPSYTPNPYIVDRLYDLEERSQDKWGLGSMVLNYTGDDISIVSSTSYFERKTKQISDETEGSNQFFLNQMVETGPGVFEPDPLNLNNAPFQIIFDPRELRFTHETRLSFDDGVIADGISGVVGFYHQAKKSLMNFPGVYVEALEDAGFQYPYLVDQKNSYTQQKDYSIFGEAYIELLPKLTVTVGLRHYWLSQYYSAGIMSGVLFEDEVFVEDARRTRESGVVPKAVISYEIGDEGNIYASASKGFRPGGDLGPMPFFCGPELQEDYGLGIDEVGPYGSDTLWSYEVGAKTRFADRRMNASVAAFKIDWSDIQQTTVLNACGLNFTANAGKAEITGFELELGGRPFADVPLTLNLGLGYTNAKLTDPGVLLQEPNGPLPNVPKWTGSISGHYETSLGDNAKFFIAADYSFSSSTKIADGMGEFYTRQAIQFTNANFGFEFGNSQLMFFAKNIFDKRYNLGDQVTASFEREVELEDETVVRYPRGSVSRPRQIGVQYSLNF